MLRRRSMRRIIDLPYGTLLTWCWWMKRIDVTLSSRRLFCGGRNWDKIVWINVVEMNPIYVMFKHVKKQEAYPTLWFG